MMQRYRKNTSPVAAYSSVLLLVVILVVVSIVNYDVIVTLAFQSISIARNHPSHRNHHQPKVQFAQNQQSNPQSVFPMIPSIEQLSKDPFMKQVSYADFIVNVLLPEDANRQTDVVMKRLRAQLSHSDGIRGFMVNYLTSSSSPPPATSTDEVDTASSGKPSVPASLMTVLKEIISTTDQEKEINRDDLIMLLCMNVIMPTGMVTMHNNAELSQQSQMTAQNAILLLKSLYDESDENTQQLLRKQLIAIHRVANEGIEMSNDTDNNDIKYWNEFFDKWGYQAIQRNGIAKAIEQIVTV